MVGVYGYTNDLKKAEMYHKIFCEKCSKTNPQLYKVKIVDYVDRDLIIYQYLTCDKCYRQLSTTDKSNACSVDEILAGMSIDSKTKL